MAKVGQTIIINGKKYKVMEKIGSTLMCFSKKHGGFTLNESDLKPRQSVKEMIEEILK